MSTKEDKLAEDLERAHLAVADAANELASSITSTGRAAFSPGRVVIEVDVVDLAELRQALAAWKAATEAMLAWVGS